MGPALIGRELRFESYRAKSLSIAALLSVSALTSLAEIMAIKSLNALMAHASQVKSPAPSPRRNWRTTHLLKKSGHA
jgi:hypothetical protein